MSRRQSAPLNMFLRMADPMPPLFPEPVEGDFYYNTVFDVIRIYRMVVGADPPRLGWQDLTTGGGDQLGKDTTWTIVGPEDPGDPSNLSNPQGLKSTPIWIDTDAGPDEGGGTGGGGGPDSTWTIIGPEDPGDPTNRPNPNGTKSSPIWIDTSVPGLGSVSPGGHTIQNHGASLPMRSKLNFTGAGVTASDASGVTNVDISGGGGGSSATFTDGYWFFDEDAEGTAAPGLGRMWIDNPTGKYGAYRLMLTGIDARGTDQELVLDWLKPGDSYFSKHGTNWNNGSDQRGTIRSVDTEYDDNLNVSVYIFGVASQARNYVPMYPDHGAEVHLRWFFNREFWPGTYLLGESDSGIPANGDEPDFGMIRLNATPYSTPLPSFNRMYVSGNDLAGQPSHFLLYNLPEGSEIRLGGWQGGDFRFTTTGVVSMDYGTQDIIYEIPVTATFRTGYIGEFAHMTVRPFRSMGGMASGLVVPTNWEEGQTLKIVDGVPTWVDP